MATMFPHALLSLLTALLLSFSFTNAQPNCPAVKRCLLGPDCPLIPVPPSSLAPKEGPAGYYIQLLRPGVYFFYANAYTSLILYKSGRLTLVDFPPLAVASDGSYLLNAAAAQVLRGRVPKRVDLVYGHRHLDHIGGAGRFAEYVKKQFPAVRMSVWATAETRDALASNPNSTLPKPSVIVGDRGRTVNIAPSLNVKLTNLGGHSPTDLACHVLPSIDGPGVMHFADVVTPGFAPFLDFGITIDLARFLQVQKELLSFDFDMLSAGHGRLGTKKDIKITIEYTMDTMQFMKEAAGEVTPEQISEAGLDRLDDPSAPQYRNPQWALKTTVDLQSAICKRKLIEKWGCRLAVVDVFGDSHCKDAFFLALSETE